jgi:hypothetical protein
LLPKSRANAETGNGFSGAPTKVILPLRSIIAVAGRR